jgi:hypothetical protein
MQSGFMHLVIWLHAISLCYTFIWQSCNLWSDHVANLHLCKKNSIRGPTPPNIILRRWIQRNLPGPRASPEGSHSYRNKKVGTKPQIRVNCAAPRDWTLGGSSGAPQPVAFATAPEPLCKSSFMFMTPWEQVETFLVTFLIGSFYYSISGGPYCSGNFSWSCIAFILNWVPIRS